VPQITLEGVHDDLVTTWLAKKDLLESADTDPDFVVEVETDSVARLRFGDDANGMRPDSGTVFTATYRVQNGRPGNVGANALDKFTQVSGIKSCCNPLPASGGTDAESLDQIRRRAPWGFLTQQRAVTLEDYSEKAEENPRVQQASAEMRWTGSWHTVFLALDGKGSEQRSADLEAEVGRTLQRYRLAGVDLDFESPDYVSLELTLEVCVCDDYFLADVQQALLDTLSNRDLPNGAKGLFHPDNLSFGQTVYLSPIYAAVRKVDGVVSVNATVFQRQGVDDPQFLRTGEMKLSARQIPRLDNDRNFPDHGRLELVMMGGK
jgi:predicted phage baseplate assembly protein